MLFDGNNYIEGDGTEEYDNLSEGEKLKLNVFYNGFRVIYPNINSREAAEDIFDAVEGAIGIVELRSRVGYDSIWGVMVENYNVMS